MILLQSISRILRRPEQAFGLNVLKLGIAEQDLASPCAEQNGIVVQGTSPHTQSGPGVPGVMLDNYHGLSRNSRGLDDERLPLSRRYVVEDRDCKADIKRTIIERKHMPIMGLVLRTWVSLARLFNRILGNVNPRYAGIQVAVQETDSTPDVQHGGNIIPFRKCIKPIGLAPDEVVMRKTEQRAPHVGRVIGRVTLRPSGRPHV